MKRVAKIYLILKYHIAESYYQTRVRSPWPQDSFYNHLSLATTLISVCVSVRNASPTKPGVGKPVSALENGHLNWPVGTQAPSSSEDLWSTYQDTKKQISGVILEGQYWALRLRHLWWDAHWLGHILFCTASGAFLPSALICPTKSHVVPLLPLILSSSGDRVYCPCHSVADFTG